MAGHHQPASFAGLGCRGRRNSAPHCNAFGTAFFCIFECRPVSCTTSRSSPADVKCSENPQHRPSSGSQRPTERDCFTRPLCILLLRETSTLGQTHVGGLCRQQRRSRYRRTTMKASLSCCAKVVCAPFHERDKLLSRTPDLLPRPVYKGRHYDSTALGQAIRGERYGVVRTV